MLLLLVSTFPEILGCWNFYIFFAGQSLLPVSLAEIFETPGDSELRQKLMK